MKDPNPLDPRKGNAQTRNGTTLFWETNKAGGRTYTSDEIPCGVEVWDTCLVNFETLIEAVALEMALQAVERRAADADREDL